MLYPFLPPEQITPQVLTALAGTIAGVPRFDVTFTHVDWFGESVAWLAPRPNHVFRSLTAAVWQRFPETPPYEGAYADTVPHLTIGHDAPKHLLDQAAAIVSTYLPIQAAVEAVQLISGSLEPGSWHTVSAFPLGQHMAM